MLDIPGLIFVIFRLFSSIGRTVNCFSYNYSLYSLSQNYFLSLASTYNIIILVKYPSLVVQLT